MESVAGKSKAHSSSKCSSGVDEKKPHNKKEQHGLMTKLGKSDLLRLLSILEGELEARDIYITNLQARINRDSHAKERYFQHRISDPFLALMRDNEAVSGSVTPSQVSNSKAFNKDGISVCIEPLPLLEKVVGECKRQQVKVKQHLALSDAYYNLVNKELLEVKGKYARDTATGDDVTAALEKEREKLQIEIRAERAKSRKIEFEYKNLLQTINKERQRFQIISTMLLEERKVRKSNFAISDDTPIEELKHQYKDVSMKNQELETLVTNMKINEASMKKEIQSLQQQLKTSHQASSTDVKTGKDLSSVKAENESHLAKNRNVAPVSGFRMPIAPPTSTDKGDRSPKVVSVKRTSSVIEKRSLKSGEKQPVGGNARALSKSLDSAEFNDARARSSLHPPERKTTGNSELTLKIASNIVSSPTSGAANFALNSPNQPPPHSFPTTLTISKGQKVTSAPSGSFQATRQKFQRFAKAKPSPPPTSQRHHVNEASAAAQSRSPKVNMEATTANAFPSVQAGGKPEAKPNAPKKSPEGSNGYKPQPPKPAKSVTSKSGKEEKGEPPRQACPPPVPPKKPNIVPKSSSVKVTATRTMRDHDVSKKPGSAGGEKSSRTSSKPSPNAASKLTNHLVSAKSSLKRPTSLGTHNSNSNNNKPSTRFSSAGEHAETSSAIVHPVPPSSAPARLPLSAQQRLFPPQEGSDGQLLSPITNTVPKSPLDSAIFKF